MSSMLSEMDSLFWTAMPAQIGLGEGFAPIGSPLLGPAWCRDRRDSDRIVIDIEGQSYS